MKIHNLRCGTDCPLGGALSGGFSTGPFALIPCTAHEAERDAAGRKRRG